jgi:hypothetical protein
MKRKMMVKEAPAQYPIATNGGNGGHSMRKPLGDDVGKGLKLSYNGKFTATGVTKKK